MSGIQLPEMPKGKEFEEYVSAFYQTAGYFIERNIIEREVEELLELDLITTNYEQVPPDIKLIEIKSGSWHFKDVFKLRGWMHYLNYLSGVLISSESKQHINFYKQKAKLIDIDLLIISDLTKTKEIISELIYAEDIDEIDINTWRYSDWVERNMMKRLKQKKKSIIDKSCYKALEDYYYEVNSGIFFTENIVKKVERLYSIFQRYPRISAKCANESLGNDFSAEYDKMPAEIYKKTYYECKYNDIQISTFIEHKARLSILKSAIDYLLYKIAGDKSKIEVNIKILGLDYEFSLFDMLPSSFISGLDIISSHEYFHKYPIFWQWFLWIFGGFIVKNYEEREYEILSNKTGILVREIPNALDCYNILFPIGGGWFMDLTPNSEIKLIKSFSVPFMGIGAHYRRIIYPESKDFNDLELTGKHTLRDLIKWNNLMVHGLSQ